MGDHRHPLWSRRGPCSSRIATVCLLGGLWLVVPPLAGGRRRADLVRRCEGSLVEWLLMRYRVDELATTLRRQRGHDPLLPVQGAAAAAREGRPRGLVRRRPSRETPADPRAEGPRLHAAVDRRIPRQAPRPGGRGSDRRGGRAESDRWGGAAEPRRTGRTHRGIAGSPRGDRTRGPPRSRNGSTASLGTPRTMPASWPPASSCSAPAFRSASCWRWLVSTTKRCEPSRRGLWRCSSASSVTRSGRRRTPTRKRRRGWWRRSARCSRQRPRSCPITSRGSS